MENYMPDEVLEKNFEDANAKVLDFINAYLQLQPKQKDYFDLEKGFKHPKSSNYYEHEKRKPILEAYSDVFEEDWDKLRNGLEYYYEDKPETFKASFTTLFLSSPYVTKQALLKRTEHQEEPKELQCILDKIAKLL